MKNSVAKELNNVLIEINLNTYGIIDYAYKSYGEPNWGNISKYRFLSEDLIREFEDKLNWMSISCYQKNLSEEFIFEFKDRLEIKILIDRDYITIKRLKELKYKFEKRNKFTRFEIMEI